MFAARTYLEDYIDHLPLLSFEAEEVSQILAKLLYIHSTRRSIPASLFRDVLEKAVATYSNNTLFLSLYLWGELGGRIYGRIQRLVSHLISTSNSEGQGVIGNLWSVWAESMLAHRTFWDKGGGGAERVKMVLDKGINSPT